MAYGASGRFNYRYGVANGIDCNNSVFGDPINGTRKACYVKVTSSQQPQPAPQPPSPPPSNPNPPPQQGTRGWSQGMYLISLKLGEKGCKRNYLVLSEHCRRVGTGVLFRLEDLRCPQKHSVSEECYYITFKGKAEKLKILDQLSEGNVIHYHWGVPTRWLIWGPSSDWSFRLVDGTTW